jgi:hypothetical protein
MTSRADELTVKRIDGCLAFDLAWLSNGGEARHHAR